MGAPEPVACRRPDKPDPTRIAGSPAGYGQASWRDRLRSDARCADGFEAGEALFKFRPPGDHGAGNKRAELDRPHDVADPKACIEGPEMTSGPLIDCPSEEPKSPQQMWQIADDAAQDARVMLSDALAQRMLGFVASAGYIGKDAAQVHDKSAITAFLEKAFNVATSALVSIGVAKIAVEGLKSLISSTLNTALATASGALAAGGEDVSFPDFQAEQANLIAAEGHKLATTWRHANVRDQLLASPYPHKEAAGLVAAANALVAQAFRTQYASSLAAWMSTVGKATGAVGEHALEVRVEFGASGSHRVVGGELDGGSAALAQAFLEPVLDKSGGRSPLELGELLGLATGLRVRVVDQSQSAFEWDPASRTITTPDNALIHHRVNAWGAAHVGQGVIPMVYAHRFLFEALGARTFAELGVSI